MKLPAFFQVGDKVTPHDSWAASMPSVPKMREGRVYCVEAVVHTQHGLRMSFVGVRHDQRGKVGDPFWPIYAFRLVHRAASGDHNQPERKEAA